MKRVNLLYSLFQGMIFILLSACSSTKTKDLSVEIFYISDGDTFYSYNAKLDNYNDDGIKKLVFIEHQIGDSQISSVTRKVKFRNITKVMSVLSSQKEDAFVSVSCCLDENGEVIAAKLKNESTAVFKSQKRKEKLMKAVMGYEFEAKTKKGIECVSLKINLQSKTIQSF